MGGSERGERGEVLLLILESPRYGHEGHHAFLTSLFVLPNLGFSEIAVCAMSRSFIESRKAFKMDDIRHVGIAIDPRQMDSNGNNHIYPRIDNSLT